MNIFKNHAAIRVSPEFVYIERAVYDARYSRRVSHINVTQPTEADWTDYRTAKRCHDYLLNSPYFDDGGPDERSSVSPPEPSREYIYAETVDEWLKRCREIDGQESP